MTLVVVIVVVVVAVLAPVVAAIALRRPLRRRWFAGTGLDEWAGVAAGLPWRDRVALHRANIRGRAAPERLAPLAVQRGRAMAAATERTRSGRWRRLYPAMAVLGVLQVVLNGAFLLDGDGSGVNAFNVVIWSFLTGLYLAMPRVQRRQLRHFRRSVDLNEQLVRRTADPA